MPKMRAKLKVLAVTPSSGVEVLAFAAVSKKEGYPSDGLDENNTFAKWSPQASMNITVANPALFGQFRVDEEYYVDFTLAEQ